MKLNVFLHQQERVRVGILATIERKIYFEYDKEFLHSKKEISPFKLPLQSGVIECTDSPYDKTGG